MEGTLRRTNVIIDGDLNSTINLGSNAHLDPLGPFFVDFFKSHGLIDIELVDMRPTWRNGRRGSQGINRRLDRFFMVECLLSSINRYRSLIVNANILDHLPMVLQFEGGFERIKHPFKFNSIWFSEHDFSGMVRYHWDSLKGETNNSPMEPFYE